MKRCGIVLLMLMLSPMIAVAGKVHVDFDTGFDFSSARSVSWGDTNTEAESELIERRIIRAVESALEESGLELRADSADLIVLSHAIVGTERKTKGGGIGIGIFKNTSWGGVSVGGSGGKQTKLVPVGTVQVQIIDAATGALVWEGSARDALVGRDSRSEARINKAVDRMFRNFPPVVGEQKKKTKR